ncbi:MAG: hypothetical protein HY934_10450 [Candidatus Firestonebacteria bacterium]|nr:hypothetical protein [Candidatus Firestonebacteria bacterium]
MSKLCHFCNNEMIIGKLKNNDSLKNEQMESKSENSRKNKNELETIVYNCPSCGVKESHINLY